MTGAEAAEQAFDLATAALLESRDVDPAIVAEIRAVVLKSADHFGVVATWMALLYSVEPTIRGIFTVGDLTLTELMDSQKEVKH